MQSTQTRIISTIFLSFFLVSAIAAPLKEIRPDDDTSTELEKAESLLPPNDGDLPDIDRLVEETNDRPDLDTDADEDVPAEEGEEDDEVNDDDRGQEVINYQDIQVDHDSKVTSENEGTKEEHKAETDQDEETKEEDELMDDEDDEDDEMDEEEMEEMEEYMLTPAAARELLLELRDPVEVAKFVVETDDAAGFIRALRLLLHDGYITEEQAYGLKDEVAAQLRNLLMLQQVELSRALFETYQPQIDSNPNADLEDMLFNQDPQPVDYYDYANLVNQEGVPYGSSQVNIYDAYQDAIEEESSQALAEIAEILAQRIARGEITPEEGAKIMTKVVQLLPDGYWGESQEAVSSESMTSEYKPDNQLLDLYSQTSDIDDIEENEFASEDDDEDDEEDDDEEDFDGELAAETKPVIEENFEEQLMQELPNGMMTEIEEEDHNGGDDATELEAEAENLADELADELREGGLSSKAKSMKLERPGAKAVVKVGPSNDVLDQDLERDVEQNWKDMSLLLDKNIPESVLRSLGIVISKEGHPALEKQEFSPPDQNGD